MNITASVLMCMCVCVCVCVWVSCQLPPRGEPGNTLSGNSVAKADSCLCISCGVVQITEVVNILDLASLGKSNCTREMSGIFPDISSRALRAQGSVIIERWTASRFKVQGVCVCVCVYLHTLLCTSDLGCVWHVTILGSVVYRCVSLECVISTWMLTTYVCIIL